MWCYISSAIDASTGPFEWHITHVENILHVNLCCVVVFHKLVPMNFVMQFMPLSKPSPACICVLVRTNLHVGTYIPHIYINENAFNISATTPVQRDLHPTSLVFL